MLLYRRGGGGSRVRNYEARRIGPRARTRTRTREAHGRRRTTDGGWRTGGRQGAEGACGVAGSLGSCPAERRHWRSRRDSVALWSVLSNKPMEADGRCAPAADRQGVGRTSRGDFHGKDLWHLLY